MCRAKVVTQMLSPCQSGNFPVGLSFITTLKVCTHKTLHSCKLSRSSGDPVPNTKITVH